MLVMIMLCLVAWWEKGLLAKVSKRSWDIHLCQALFQTSLNSWASAFFMFGNQETWYQRHSKKCATLQTSRYLPNLPAAASWSFSILDVYKMSNCTGSKLCSQLGDILSNIPIFGPWQVSFCPNTWVGLQTLSPVHARCFLAILCFMSRSCDRLCLSC